MKKRLLALMTVLSALALGTTTFTSCNKEDDDKVDTIYVVNKDTVYVDADTLVVYNTDTLYIFNNDTIYLNNGGGSSATPGVYGQGWLEYTIKDLNGKVLFQGKQAQTVGEFASEPTIYTPYLRDTIIDPDGDWHYGLQVTFQSPNESYSKLTTGSYFIVYDYEYLSDIMSSNNLGVIAVNSDLVSPIANQKHNITKVEKIGQYINGNYLYAIEGNFNIKMGTDASDNNYTYASEAKYIVTCKYRVIAESDYYAENE